MAAQESAFDTQLRGHAAAEGRDATKEQWETAVTRIGGAGLQLNKSLDALGVDELAQMLNMYHTGGGRLLSRRGQTLLQTFPGKTSVHSINRLNDPQNSAFADFYGVDTTLWRDNAQIDSGYSGKPLSMIPTRPFIGAGTWLITADSTKMGYAPRTGAVLPLGIAPPAVAATTAAQSILRTQICAFDSSDNTDAANWTVNKGQDRSTPPIPMTVGGAVTDVGGAPQNNAVAFETSKTGAGFNGAKTGYSAWFGAPISVDASTLNSGVAATADEDIMHVWVKLINPLVIEEVRIYLVINPGFDPTALPGTGIGGNTDAFVKAFAPADINDFINQLASAQTTAEGVASKAARRNSLGLTGVTQGDMDALLKAGAFNATTKFRYDASKVEPPVAIPGTTWGEFGTVGIPVRRGDFQRIGNTSGIGWNTITGIVVFIQTSKVEDVQLQLDDLYITGGYSPDTSDPATTPYDYRYTYYDPRTGFESNPSPIQSGAFGATSNTPDLTLDLLRQAANLTPSPHPDANMRERWYRRGGTLVGNWSFLGTSTAHGQVFSDTFGDLSIAASGVLAINHDQPITTTNAQGGTVLAQPLNAVWGPTDGGYVFGCGDPYRPGYLYWCIPGNVGAWPALSNVEVCSSSEQLINGCVWGGQTYAFSKERLYVVYPNFDGSGNVRVSSTACPHGLAARTGLVTTPFGMVFITRDGIRLTSGSSAELLSADLWNLFHGVAIRDGAGNIAYQPIDMSLDVDMQLTYHDGELWFIYRDTAGLMQCLIYRLVNARHWRQYAFGKTVGCVFSDTGATNQALFGGKTTGMAYTHSGFTDDGTTISWALRTGSWDVGQPRVDKQLGDMIIDIDLQNTTLTAQALLNTETTVNASQSVVGAIGRRRYIFDAFTTLSQKARTVAFYLTGTSAAAAQVILEFIGVSMIPQPDITMLRATNWDDLGSPTEKYVYGIQVEADTFNGPVLCTVEYSLNGVLTTGPTFTITTNGRHKQRFTWPVVKADLIRIRPSDGCAPWQLYRLDWIDYVEPPRIAGWDTNWETLGDAYITGIDLECDTFGLNKTVQLWIDQVLIQTFTVNTAGRKLLALTVNSALPSPGIIRGRVFRLVSTDANQGLLYGWKWIVDKEPGLQTNWNFPIETAGTLTDKWIKGIILDADTFGASKTYQLEIDGVVVFSGTVTHPSRSVVMYSWPQLLGRNLRFYPNDNNPARLYSHQWIFDEEPLQLTRWESQEVDHEIHGWQTLLWGNFTIKTLNAVDAITMTVLIYGNSGTLIATQIYTIPATNGLKQKVWLPFQAAKGALYKYIFTCPSGFWLYREESEVMIHAWGGNEPLLRKPFGDDDLDTPARGMGKASLAAAHASGDQEKTVSE
jgi:hypothetical protein